MNNYIFCWELRPINPKFVQMNAHSITSIACGAASPSESETYLTFGENPACGGNPMKRLIPALIVSSNFPVFSQMSVSPHLTLGFWGVLGRMTPTAMGRLTVRETTQHALL